MITRTVSQLAELCGATLEGDGDRVVNGPAPLRDATSEEFSFLVNPAYAPELERTSAGAVVVPLDLRLERDDLALLRTENPNRAFSRLIEVFRPERRKPAAGIHPTAHVADGARIGEGACVGPLCSIGAEAELGPGAVLHANVTVGAGCKVGAGSVLHPGVVLYAGVEVGGSCILHGGVVIGSDGFGFDPTATGWEKVPQCGSVVVEDDVEIGANTTVDCGRFGVTRIGRGSKLDNLVQIGHNVQIGEAALLVAQCGIAGSVKIGSRAIIAGQAGVAGHITIGDGARLGAQSGVSKDLEPGSDYFGSPAVEKGEAYRIVMLTRKLPDMYRRLKQLEKSLNSGED